MNRFSRREREIMDAVYLLGEADAEQILSQLKDPPGYDSVRTTLRILENKGHLKHRTDGRRHVYKPLRRRTAVLRDAWQNLVDTFFAGSEEQAAATLLRKPERKALDDGTVAGLMAQTRDAKRRRKGGMSGRTRADS